MVPFSFWIWWSLTIVLCGYPLLRAWMKSSELLGLPVTGALMWLYIYVYLPYGTVCSHPDLLPGWLLAFAAFLPCVCFASFLAGWYLNLGHRPRTASGTTGHSLHRLWNWGIGLLIVGNAGLYSFHYSENAFAQTSAYWYMLFQVGYAGIALCIAVWTLKRRSIENTSLVVFATLVVLLIAPSLLHFRRGPTFTAIIVAAFSYFLLRPSSLKLWKVIAVLGTAGVLMIVLVHRGGTCFRGSHGKRPSRQPRQIPSPKSRRRWPTTSLSTMPS